MQKLNKDTDKTIEATGFRATDKAQAGSPPRPQALNVMLSFHHSQTPNRSLLGPSLALHGRLTASLSSAHKPQQSPENLLRLSQPLLSLPPQTCLPTLSFISHCSSHLICKHLLSPLTRESGVPITSSPAFPKLNLPVLSLKMNTINSSIFTRSVTSSFSSLKS